MPVTWSDEKLILLCCPGRDRTHDLPLTVASNMVKVSHALHHSATAAVNITWDDADLNSSICGALWLNGRMLES